MKSRTLAIMALLCGLAGTLVARNQAYSEDRLPKTPSASVKATSAQPAVPLLVRNDHGPAARVIIDVPNGTAIELKQLRFRLAGTDIASDIESLRLFSTGEKPEFSPASPLGEAVPPAETSSFNIGQTLKAGRHVFWLGCRLKSTADLSHGIAAAGVAAETSAGRVSISDETPDFRHRIGIAVRKHNDDGVHTYRIPALTTSAKGTLLMAYDMRRRTGRDLQEDIDIGLSRSADGGRTWEPARVIMDMGEYENLPQEQNGCSDPGLIVDRQTGEIFCFAVWMYGKPGKHQWRDDGSEAGYEIGKSAQFLMVRSKDDGVTWSKPENLTRALKKEAWWLFAPAPQQGFQTNDGRLVMPSQGRDEKGRKFSTLMTSVDHGATWTVGTPAHFDGSECQAAPLGDGSIMLNVRNDREKFRAVYTTRDFGKTWTPHETNRNTLIEPTCNASLLRVTYEESGQRKHALLFSNPHTQTARTHQTIQVSFDDGKTWPKSHHLLLDEGRGAGYSSLTQIDDRHVGIVYEGSQSHLTFQRFSLEELLRR